MKRKYKISIIGVCVLSLISYPISYSIILPLFEDTGLYPVFNIIYSPVEKIRNESTFFYSFTEAIYSSIGDYPPEKRYFFKNSIRRKISFGGKGQIIEDALYKNGNYLSGTSYYDNGNVECRIIELEDKGIVEHWHENGAKRYYFVINNDGTGFSENYDASGVLIAKCTYKNKKRWTGTVMHKGSIVYYEEGNKQIK